MVSGRWSVVGGQLKVIENRDQPRRVFGKFSRQLPSPAPELLAKACLADEALAALGQSIPAAGTASGFPASAAAWIDIAQPKFEAIDCIRRHAEFERDLPSAQYPLLNSLNGLVRFGGLQIDRGVGVDRRLDRQFAAQSDDGIFFDPAARGDRALAELPSQQQRDRPCFGFGGERQ
ncbi:MAG TPA: hypothetical protein VGI40_01710 [Pirellulaceae bacterium]|jgi:hypothetical protein